MCANFQKIKGNSVLRGYCIFQRIRRLSLRAGPSGRVQVRRCVKSLKSCDDTSALCTQERRKNQSMLSIYRGENRRLTDVRKMSHGCEKVFAQLCDDILTDVRRLSHGCATSFSRVCDVFLTDVRRLSSQRKMTKSLAIQRVLQYGYGVLLHKKPQGLGR